MLPVSSVTTCVVVVVVVVVVGPVVVLAAVVVEIPAKVTCSAEIAQAPLESPPYLQAPVQSKFVGPEQAVQAVEHGKHLPTETSKNCPELHDEGGVVRVPPIQNLFASARTVPSKAAFRCIVLLTPSTVKVEEKLEPPQLSQIHGSL